MINKLRIGFDINNTIDDFVEKILIKYNEKYMENVQISDIIDYNIHKFLNSKVKNVFKELVDEKLIQSLEPRKGSCELLHWCYENNFEIRFITAIYPYLFGFEYDWLCKHFDCISHENLCRIEDKKYYDIDILLDDWEQNLIGGKYDKILISQPWNVDIDVKKLRINRADNLQEAKELIKLLARRKGFIFS